MLIELFFRIVFDVILGFNAKELGDLNIFDYRDHSWNYLANQMTGDIPVEHSAYAMCTLGTELFAFGGERRLLKLVMLVLVNSSTILSYSILRLMNGGESFLRKL
jgi:hypothetical protein